VFVSVFRQAARAGHDTAEAASEPRLARVRSMDCLVVVLGRRCFESKRCCESGSFYRPIENSVNKTIFQILSLLEDDITTFSFAC
jgi:hypothetical protein